MSHPALYNTDFYAWTQEQCQALVNKAWADLDGLNYVFPCLYL
ncbi:MULTISPECIES: DUF29 family protein [unclassified Thermosynechococcus]|nr:DUF29 domain-containing protein [Thermosynechococcus sp. CL-1]QSF49339.1 DUF29 family protein [Thermosynechococcus sp. TA-1]